MECRIKIEYKFPSMNEYIDACRRNKYAGSSMKKSIQRDISWSLNRLPEFKNPIKIDFIWIEKNKKRDLDNVSFSKKFILDALVECKKIKNDNQNWVKSFTDSVEIGKEYGVKLKIQEVKN